MNSIRYPAVIQRSGQLAPCEFVLHEKRLTLRHKHGQIVSVIEAAKGPVEHTLAKPVRIFRSLNRPAAPHERTVQSGDFLAYVGKPPHTFTYEPVQGVVQCAYPPSGRVFLVWVAPNKDHRSDWPSIAGWIDHWCWVECDPADENAPIHYQTRFEEQLWPR